MWLCVCLFKPSLLSHLCFLFDSFFLLTVQCDLNPFRYWSKATKQFRCVRLMESEFLLFTIETTDDELCLKLTTHSKHINSGRQFSLPCKQNRNRETWQSKWGPMTTMLRKLKEENAIFRHHFVKHFSCEIRMKQKNEIRSTRRIFAIKCWVSRN